MYAVVTIQGFQYKVSPEDRIEVPNYPAAVGDRLALDHVMLVSDGEKVVVGMPTVSGATVEAEVLTHLRGPKHYAGKYKRRKDYRRRWGYRSDLTRLRIGNIHLDAKAGARKEAGSGAGGAGEVPDGA
jgi:large subunit ribosomal protein L21